MTDTATIDLAAWLDAIWGEREKACQEAQDAIDTYTATAGQGDLELRWMLQLRRGGVFQGGWDMPGPPTPAEDLARIAADRKILALHHKFPQTVRVWICPSCAARHGFPCPTLRLLASPYKGREGWQEAWGHE